MIEFTLCPSPCKKDDCSECPVYKAYLIGIDYILQQLDCKQVEESMRVTQ